MSAWRGWNDYAVAPLCEEFCFRACMVPLMLAGGFSPALTVLVTPIFFGAAHLHRLRELIVVSHMSLQEALPSVSETGWDLAGNEW